MTANELELRIRRLLPDKICNDPYAASEQNAFIKVCYQKAIDDCVSSLIKSAKVLYVNGAQDWFNIGDKQEHYHGRSFIMLDLFPIKQETCADVLREIIDKLEKPDIWETSGYITRAKDALIREGAE